MLAAVLFIALSDPSGLSVSSSYWGRVETVDVASGKTLSQEALDPNDAERGIRGFSQTATRLTRRETYALVRNTGSRKTKVVEWEYVFYDTAKRDHEIKRYPFRTKAGIAPGEAKFLTQLVTDAAPSVYGDVVIVRVEYDDGTSWQNPAVAPNEKKGEGNP